MIYAPTAIIDYHPYWTQNALGEKVRNPEFTKGSGYILDLKKTDNPQKTNTAERIFLPHLLEYIKKTYGHGVIEVLAIVPGHEKGSISLPLSNLIRVVAARIGAKAIPGLLKRTSTIAKLAHGGDRSINVHLNSLAVTNHAEIENKTVLVLDDVMTSGNSLLACGNLLNIGSARSVHLLALAKTTR